MSGMAWTYILRCADESFYVSSTRDLDQRLSQHDLGAVDAYTKKRRPVVLVWAQEVERIDEAYALEGKIKGWRRAKREALIEGRYNLLPGLSRSGSHRSRSDPSG